MEFRLVTGWSGSQPGEAAIFQVKPEEEKTASEKGKLVGVSWEPNFAVAEEAYEFLKGHGWSETPPE